MSGHTKGPWDAGVSIWNGNEVFTAVSRKDTSIITAICGFTGAEDEEESIANAHLIAAAPELLEALEQTQSLLERLGLESSDEYQANAAAIAKAKGEQ